MDMKSCIGKDIIWMERLCVKTAERIVKVWRSVVRRKVREGKDVDGVVIYVTGQSWKKWRLQKGDDEDPTHYLSRTVVRVYREVFVGGRMCWWVCVLGEGAVSACLYFVNMILGGVVVDHSVTQGKASVALMKP